MFSRFKSRKVGTQPDPNQPKLKRFGSLNRNKSKPTTPAVLKSLSSDSLFSGKQVVIPLLSIEEECFLQNGAPISTLTWFEGDHETAAEILEKKIGAILNANPWLAGRITNRNGKAALVHPEFLDALVGSDTLEHVTNPKKSSLHRFVAVQDLAELSKNFLVQNNSKCKVWKVTVVPSCEFPGQSFAVILSMSHCVGDVYTFYQIHNMLMGNANIQPLNVNRAPNSAKDPKEYCMLDSSGFLKDKSKVMPPKIKRRYFLLDNEELQQQIRTSAFDRFTALAPSDVLSSWFFRQSGCGHGLVTINERNGGTLMAAGNYENTLFCYPEDYSTPAAMQIAAQRASTTPFLASHAKGKFSLFSNWACFAQDSSLPDCREDLHVPLFPAKGKHPLTNNSSASIMFRAGPGKVAMYVVASPNVMEGLEHSSLESCEL